ncbi:MAG: bifunctional ADP-heptose synthase [Bacteroidetes bacterium]|jgi:rfaE bifunctional protein kinase chain/domain|nr:bifunctional ADP-heptose synthase [Bacteroidota bacterium]MDF1868132.1 PfkB family carbohydrate kinase [Saprospiraceae bacterium]
MNHSKNIFDAFNSVKVLVIGDVMIDRYLIGNVTRISPEAPVPIIDSLEEEERLGGAANVALNISALGAKPILCSVIGHDKSGVRYLEIMQENGLETAGIIQSRRRITTSKTRVIAGGQHLLRVDREHKNDLEEIDETVFLESVIKILDTQKIDVILFQDYNKGVLTKKVIKEVISKSHGLQIPTVVDPKFKNFWNYNGVTLIKPNLKEIRDALNQEVLVTLDSLDKACQKLMERLENRISLITLSEYGIYFNEGKDGKILPTKSRDIADVCGAGDTVISTTALGIAIGLGVAEIAKLANLAGGQVCEKVGVVQVDKKRLFEEFGN